jgi:SOS-response transcriptional repressor LexA
MSSTRKPKKPITAEDRQRGRRMRQLRNAAGMTQDQVAERIGISRVAVTNWESGKNSLESGRVPEVAALYGVSADQLLGKIAMEESTTGARYVVERVRVVLRGLAQVRDGGYLSPIDNSTDESRIVQWHTTDRSAYAIEIRGDSLRPEIPAGAVLIVEPGRPVQPGRKVIVTLIDGRQLIRRVGWQRGGQIELQPIGAGPVITLPEAEIASMHRIVGVADDDIITEG